MAMDIKNMEKPTINVPKVPEDTARRVDIFILEKKHKEAKRKEKTFEENNKKTYILILQHCTPELEGKLNGIDKYDAIETYQDGIELDKLIRTICHLQDDEKNTSWLQ